MAIILIISLVFGLIIGSFLNVLICRLPRGASARGRSYCPHCKRTLEWFELIPVLSFLALKRKCRTCAQIISWQYPLVELATALLFAVAAAVHITAREPLTTTIFLTLLRDWIIIAALIVTFATDFLSQLIYDGVLLYAGILIFLLGLATGAPLWQTLFGGIIGASFFGFQYLVSKGKWIGAGDIILGGFLGIALSFPDVLTALALSYVTGLFIAVPLLLLKKKKWESRIAFGTFLSLAGIMVLLWGKHILNWYLTLIFT